MMVKQFGIRGKRRFKLKNNIFIPKTINVGYQNRKGTYTGKLAYVIYYDKKGNFAKKRPGMAGEIKISQMKNLKMYQQKDLC